MTAYVAILEDAGPSTAAGVWFPDLPGCFSAGDDIDEALRNAGEAIAASAGALSQDGRALPASARTEMEPVTYVATIEAPAPIAEAVAARLEAAESPVAMAVTLFDQ